MTRSGLLSVCVVAVLATAARPVGAADEPVVIRLHDRANVGSKIVQIGHIAEVVGGDRQLRDRIRQLDLTQVEDVRPDEPEVIKRPLLQVRLLLADVPKSDYVLLGASEVHVYPGEGDQRDNWVLDAIQKAVAIEMKQAQDDIQVRLTQPLGDDVKLEYPLGEKLRCDPFLPPVVRPGRSRIKLGVFADQKLVRTFNASVEIRVIQTVATAARKLDRGEILSLKNLKFERKPLTTLNGIADADDLLGSSVRRPIAEGQPVNLRDLEGDQKKSNPVVIHARDVVKVKARRGTLTVFLHQGVALNNGRIGEYVRVRNPRGRQIITGKVINSTEVEVNF